jgi:hypothetical protein
MIRGGAATKRRRIEIAVPPYDQSEDWLQWQTDADPAVRMAYAHSLVTEDHAVAGEWVSLGGELLIRWAVEAPGPPNNPRLRALYFVAKHEGGYMASAISCETFPGISPGTFPDWRSPWRRLHRMVSRVPEVHPARFASLADAKSAVDDLPEARAAWARGCLGWRPLLEENYEYFHDGTWERQRGSGELWSRKDGVDVVVWVGRERDRWVVFTWARNPKGPFIQRPRKRRLSDFADRDQAFAAADHHILKLSPWSATT